jgi:UDP-N-acetylglucosamine 2-epimerase (non-hydrolysing)
MKLVTVLGTRPEIIRLSRIIPLLDAHADQVLVHTGQNYDPLLSEVFFDELGLRRADEYLGIEAHSFGEQAGRILAAVEQLLRRERPDRVLVLGDTNSGLAAIVAARMGIPVFHLEAGNRCFDDRVPEEINRRVIDHCSSVLMPYTERSRMNLLREGVASDRIHVVGNPIGEVMTAQGAAIDASDARQRLGLEAGRYFLATTHRQENVDREDRLRSIVAALASVGEEHGLPLLWSVHPRTLARLQEFGIEVSSQVRVVPPMGFADFVSLERSAACVFSDSGTVQEECAIMRVPNVTLRDVTERPETVECGSNILAGVEPASVSRATRLALAAPPAWDPPPEYLRRDVSQAVARIVLGYPDGRSKRA